VPLPNDLVDRFGREVTVTRVGSYDVNVDGGQNITREYEHTKAVLFNPSVDDQQMLEGRIDAGSIGATVPSGLDLRANRDGGKDRLIVDGHVDPSTATDVTAYTVMSDETDSHPMFPDLTKATFMCDRFSGRERLSEDADTYTQA